MIRGVIYDMDDLMVNSDPLHAQAWEVLLEKHGHKFSELPQELRSNFIGMRVIDILREIVEYLKLNADIERLYQERIDIFLELAEEKLEAMPGLYDSLALLKKHRYRLALASSGAKKYIDMVLKKFAIADYFDVIVSGDDVSKGKPDPETYLVAANKLGLSPAECLVLEDATKGIQAAKAAGCKCIAIKNPHTPRQDHSRADNSINSLEEITLETLSFL